MMLADMEAVKRVWTLVMVTWVLARAAQAHVKHFLYYSSPGGQEQGLPGLYGGYMNPDNMGHAHDLQQSAIKCAALSNGFYNGLHIKGLSYDPYSDEVLLEIDEYTETKTSLVKASLCQSNLLCDESAITEFFSAATNTDRLQQAVLGPFARWKSDIYFVVRRYRQGEQKKQRIMRMSIYKLIGCQNKYPFTAYSPIDLDSCSEEVALILEERAEDVVMVMRETQQPSSSLHVVDSGTTIYFLLQLQNQVFDRDMLQDYYMDLYVAQIYNTQPAQLLHSQQLPSQWTWHRLKNIGAIDYKHGVLCWSAIDRILCSKWKPGHSFINEVHQVLSPGDAAYVCNATKEFQAVTTGVAIAKESNSLALYFGCLSQSRDSGGAGLLTLDADWRSSHVHPLVDRHGMVLAGNMFITEACENMALVEHDDRIQADANSQNLAENREEEIEEPRAKDVMDKTESHAQCHLISLLVLTLTVLLHHM